MPNYIASYKPGDWKGICDRCGFTFKASELKKTWDGLMVCDKDWETRHPMDFLKAPKGEKALPWVRPENTDQTTTINSGAGYVDTGNNSIPSGNNDGSL